MASAGDDLKLKEETPLGPEEVGHADRADIRILVVDDERTLRETCKTFLDSQGYSVEVASKGDEAKKVLETRRFDIALLDLYMTGVPGLELLRTCLENNPDTIVIMATGNPSIESSVAALREGAWDYLAKPFSATQLEILIGRAAHLVLVDRESREAPRGQTILQANGQEVNILGESPIFSSTIDRARKVARTDASVFITGESGVGKELVAHFIHANSRRNARPMVAINCAALPEQLLESEMFGHRKGAFTDAVRDKAGLLETANGGTMFLDELTEMSKPIQAKLLRVIQDGVVRRVGSESVDAVVNVRFVAATNRDPKQAVEEGLLREDLYYRLHVVPLRVPPLRDRKSDIPVLAKHFLDRYWARHRDRPNTVPALTEESLAHLIAYPWHGNVRELQNLIEHAVVLVDQGADITPEDLPFSDPSTGKVAVAADSGAPNTELLVNETYHDARERVLKEFELKYLQRLVSNAQGNMSKAAREAGVDRTTLYRLMEKHGLQRETIMVELDQVSE